MLALLLLELIISRKSMQLSNSHFLDNDITLSNQPEGSITCVRWAYDHASMFAIGTWGGQLKIYNIEENELTSKPALIEKFSKQVKWPVTDVAWSKNNEILYYSLIDNTVNQINLFKPIDKSKICTHDEFVRNIFFLESQQSLVTVSFDKTMKVWDFKQPSPSKNLYLGHKPYATDIKKSIAACGFSNEMISTFHIFSHPKQIIQTSQLGNHSQIQSIALDMEAGMMAYGSNDGRVSLARLQHNKFAELVEQAPVFSFKAEKEELPGATIMHGINAIGFNTRNPKWFFTGSSQALSAWNYQSKNRIDSTPTGKPVTCGQVSPSGYFLAYGLGDDYHLGPDIPVVQPPTLCVHYISENEIQKTKWV